MANDIKQSVYTFDVNDYKSTQELTAFGKKAAKFVNRRLAALQREGLVSRATTGGVKKINVRAIKTKAQAIRAVSKARQLISNPLSTPGHVKKLLRDAQKQYGVTSSRIKWIAVETPVLDAQGKPTGVTKLVPMPVPWGTEKGATPWYDAKQQIKSYWNWYHDQMEQWVSSEEAQQMWEASGYRANTAKRLTAESSIASKTAKEIEQVFGDQISKASHWLD